MVIGAQWKYRCDISNILMSSRRKNCPIYFVLYTQLDGICFSK